jgi:hypothetical protein
MLVVPVFLKERSLFGVMLDTGCWMLIVPVFLKRRLQIGVMLDAQHRVSLAPTPDRIDHPVSSIRH